MPVERPANPSRTYTTPPCDCDHQEPLRLATTKRPKVKTAKRKKAAVNGSVSSNGSATKKPVRRRRRATAESMAAGQRDISVSEFFAKNRHLLGFDNPRKALLTTVKEAVDNALDACEEAAILPEIWVHIEATKPGRFKVGIQDNGPGILKKQIPLIFGKLLYGSKFHRLRMSRGQQGIGISAAGMYGLLTTGKPVKIMSKVSVRKPAHYYEIQIDTKRNQPEIVNGRGEGVDIPPGQRGAKTIDKHGIEWNEQDHGTRVTIELEAKYQRGRGSVDEYLEQTAIANPHVVAPLRRSRGQRARPTQRVAEVCCRHEPKEIKPHPYGVELGRLVGMMQGDEGADDLAVLDHVIFQGHARPWRGGSAKKSKVSTSGQHAQDRPARGRSDLSRHPEDEDPPAFDRLHLPDRRGVDPQRIAPGCAGRVLRRRPLARRPSIAATRS